MRHWQPAISNREAQEKRAQEEGGVWRARDMGDCEERRMAEELLTNSSGDESDGGFSRFEESSRWIAEMGEHTMEAESVVPGDVSNEDFVKGALATLDMLERRWKGWV
jgi:hypothetical protein